MPYNPVDQSILDGLDPGEDVPRRVAPQVELGQTGLRRVSGYVEDEFLPQLRGRKAVQIYREMADNDPIVGSLLYSIDRLLREIEWRVEPASNSAQDRQAAEFLEGCMEDMSHTWDDFISEILSMLAYGWSWHEIVYKKRVGPWEKDPRKRSKFSDGKYGWRKMPIRAQETLMRWVFDETGGIKALVQLSPPMYTPVTIPIEKSVLFRVSNVKNNPEGRSILRNSYRPWYMKKRLEEIEAVGVERDLAGLPVAKLPSEYLSAMPGTKQANMTEAFRKMVRAVRRDEQEGILLPSEFDEDTKQPLFDFQLLTSGGTRQFDTNAIISRYEQRILMTVLADFILVGHEDAGGSYALHTDKSGLFRASINSIAQSIADTINRYAVPRLFELNGEKLDELPQIKPNDVDPPNLTELAGFMTQLAGIGMTFFPDVELEKFLRDAARLPQLDEQAEQVREVEERQGEILRLSQQRLDLVGMQQQAEAGAQQNNATDMQNEQQEQTLQNAPGDRKMQMQQHQAGLKESAAKAKAATMKKPAAAPRKPVGKGPKK